MQAMICSRSLLAPFANSPGHEMRRKRYASPDTARCYKCHVTVAPSIFGDGPCRKCGNPMRPVWWYSWECSCQVAES